jgi:hypothetical protein
MDSLKLYKSFYDRETNRRDILNNSVAIPIGILSGLIAALFFLASDFNYEIKGIFYCLFLGLIIIGAIMLIIAVTYLAKSFTNFIKGHDYSEIAFLHEIELYRSELIVHYKRKEKAEKKFMSYLKSEFIRCADHNAILNDRRSFFIFKTKQYLFIAVIAISLAYIPYGITKYKELNLRPRGIPELLNNKDLTYEH